MREEERKDCGMFRRLLREECIAEARQQRHQRQEKREWRTDIRRNVRVEEQTEGRGKKLGNGISAAA